jgi:phosphoribosylaminoimidazole carboxylase PurE protein
MGSDSDLPAMAECVKVLESYRLGYDIRVLSAHRSPEQATRFAREAERRGFKLVIAGAGGSAHLAGVVAAHTLLPVIGVPLAGSSLAGVDALLSTVQMPTGIPVATVGVGAMGAANAGHLAVTLLAMGDARLRARVGERRKAMAAAVLEKSKALPGKLRELLK